MIASEEYQSTEIKILKKDRRVSANQKTDCVVIMQLI